VDGSDPEGHADGNEDSVADHGAADRGDPVGAEEKVDCTKGAVGHVEANEGSVGRFEGELKVGRVAEEADEDEADADAFEDVVFDALVSSAYQFS